MSDLQLITSLMEGVRKCVRPGGSELDVVTFISPKLWVRWCKAVGDSPDQTPTDWDGLNTHRIYGSKTILIASDEEIAVSVHRSSLAISL